MKKSFFAFLILIFLISFACNPRKRKVNPVLYHWKTNLALSVAEKAYCDSLHVQKLYVKAFDVDWDKADNQAIPKAILQVNNKENLPQNMALCVFITNSVWENTDKVTELAEKISRKLSAISDSLQPIQVNEIQIDSDWTPKTKEHYFTFLEKLKTYLPHNQALSVTLRLHQIKFFEKAGVPPVKSGTLMFYNMSDVTQKNTQNSILDIKVAKNYLVNFDRYPLHIDLILPTFSWGVLKRQGRFLQLLSDFEPDSVHFVQKSATEYQVSKSHYYKGIYLYEGDEIRIEKAEQKDLLAAAKLLSPLLSKTNLNIGFYHLSPENIEQYPSSFVQKILDSF